MNKSIRVLLDGGLGNQLFQYAYSLYLQERFNTNINLDTCILGSCGLRKMELDKIVSFNNDKIVIVNRKFSFFDKVLFRISNLLQSPFMGYYSETECEPYDKYLSPDITNYKGYWQNANYLIKNRTDILSNINFSTVVDGSFLINKYKIDNNSVSIHVRRGDYVSDERTSKVHGNVCGSDYYKKAIELMKSKLGNINFLIVSDDPEWCVSEFAWLKNSQVVMDTNSHFEDMFIMSRCKGNIIANSTFSWWAAFVNTNEDNVVIAPERWFFNTEVNNIIPYGWFKV
ncbi:alpha-1,2-fucosyltransferase [Vibrio furnissii]